MPSFDYLQPSRHNWMFVFYISAAIYVIGAIAYSIMATGVEQEWNKIRAKSENEERKQLLSEPAEE